MNKKGKYPPSAKYPSSYTNQNRASDNWRARADRQFMRNQHHQQGMHPALKAALIMMIPLIIMQLLNAFAFTIPVYISYPIQLLVYLACGNLAGRFFADSIHHVRPRNLGDQVVKSGAAAGLTLGILSFVFVLLFVVILKLVSFGINWFGSYSFIICAPLDILVALCLGALGAKIFESSWR